jgi:hypothetical protein
VEGKIRGVFAKVNVSAFPNADASKELNRKEIL